ncbi:MAG: F0F1 ATP synthase subunit delta [Pseudomonadota bacterium]
MHEDQTIARPYATAAYKHAVEEGTVQAWGEMLARLGEATGLADMKALIAHPRVSAEQLAEICEAVVGPEISDKQRNFIKVLIEAERVAIAPGIVEQFEALRARAEGLNNVELSSAFPMSDAEIEKISTSLSDRFGGECKVSCQVDESLIGGVVIKIGDAVIDLSISGRLRSLGQALT